MVLGSLELEHKKMGTKIEKGKEKVENDVRGSKHQPSFPVPCRFPGIRRNIFPFFIFCFLSGNFSSSHFFFSWDDFLALVFSPLINPKLKDDLKLFQIKSSARI